MAVSWRFAVNLSYSKVDTLLKVNAEVESGPS